MKNFELDLGGKELKIEVAANDADRRTGLSGIDKIDKGMLFVFPYTGKHQMWMKNTRKPLDIMFINEKGIVTELVKGDPQDLELLGTKDNTRYVLELPYKTADVYDIEVGDILPIPPEMSIAEDEKEAPTAALLDQDGNPQMDILGGERVFSRPKTLEIIAAAKKAASEGDMELLGKLIAEEIMAQDSRGSQYVEEGKTKLQYAQEGSKITKEEEEVEEEMKPSFKILLGLIKDLSTPENLISENELKKDLNKEAIKNLQRVAYSMIASKAYTVFEEDQYDEFYAEVPSEDKEIVEDLKVFFDYFRLTGMEREEFEADVNYYLSEKSKVAEENKIQFMESGGKSEDSEENKSEETVE